eukprot:gene57370-78602_t
MLTYRYRGHSMSDPAKYRSKDEVQKMRSEHDPIEQVRARLLEKAWASEDDLKAIDKDVRDIVADAADFAQADKEPDVRNGVSGSDAAWIVVAVGVVVLFSWYFWHVGVTMLRNARAVADFLDGRSARLRRQLEYEAVHGGPPLWYRLARRLIIFIAIAAAAALGTIGKLLIAA